MIEQLKGTAGSVVKLALVAAIGTLIAWRAVVVNMADYFARGTDSDDAVTALKWDSRQPEALYALGSNGASNDPATARVQLEQAIQANPSDGRSYATLSAIYEKQGDLRAADNAMTTATAMAPRRVDVQTDAATYWIRRGDVARAMKHWNVVLRFAPESWEKLFPPLLSLAEVPANRDAFAPLLKDPVEWWPAFFAHAAANAQSLDTVRALYNLQAKGPNDATPEALRAYLDRLQREGYWTESYFAWLNSLGKDQLGAVGNLFNGGFEEPISNLGFDWISTPAGTIVVETAPTYGITGQKALHVLFRGPRVRFRHLGQFMMLAPGEYSMRGRVRLDSLETEKGLQWAVYCLDGDEPLATSDRFSGTDQWRHFRFQFSVPRDCRVQLVRLELAGRVALDFDAKGSIWFDDLGVDAQSLLD